MKTRSALSYFGSDSEVAEQLASLLDSCKHVSIPFCGGCSILPSLKARAIVCNDANDLVVNFYRVISGVYGETSCQHLIDRCEATLSHPSEIRWASAIIEAHRASPVLTETSRSDLAWAYWALCWIGRKGQGGTKYLGGNASVRRTALGGNNATRIRAAAGDLKEWAKQFERCEFECLDFQPAIASYVDIDGNGIYCDPPWVSAGRNYVHSFTNDDHCRLAHLLSQFNHTIVVIRYDDHPLVRQLYSSWSIVESSSRTQSNKSKGELWITNKRDL